MLRQECLDDEINGVLLLQTDCCRGQVCIARQVEAGLTVHRLSSYQ